MQISIDSLSVTGLGPVVPIKWKFKDVNLIYGRNEQGKTFIVEYLLNSLFRKAPKTRQLTDSGQVSVSGLGSGSLRFHPKSRQKLEDFLFPDDQPVDLSRLLVVKAGQSKFSPDLEKGINKTILKDYLSDQRTLDEIMSRIQVNIQKSSWENGQLILGANQGDCKQFTEQLSQFEKADRLLSEVEDKYAWGEIAKEKSELHEVEGLIQNQENARRYLAYQKSIKIQELNEKLDQYPRQDLDDLKLLHNKIQELRKQIKKDQDEVNALEPQCTHYQWLDTAIHELEKQPDALKVKSDLLFIIPVILLIVGAIVFSFLEISWGSLASGLVALLLFILTIFHYRSKLQHREEIAEVNRTFQEYETYFGKKARSITGLKAVFDALTPKYYSLQDTKDRIKENKDRLSGLQEDLTSQLFSLTGQRPDISDVETVINDLQSKRDELEEHHQQEDRDLAGLAVEPEEYLSEPAATQYDRQLLSLYKTQKEELITSIKEKRNALQTLKQRVCDLTSMEISSPWENLIDALRNHRDEKSQSMKDIKAKIGSGVVVTEVINEIRDREDEGITKALASNQICKPIQALTHTYQGVDMQGDDIYVFSEYERFPLHEISTGAQEQILLALRIGIASYFLKDQKMFLILDDAFQHSDWQRREWMVDQMADLASIGWQIIYFAMDDHIKGLFEERIQPKFPERYASFELIN